MASIETLVGDIESVLKTQTVTAPLSIEAQAKAAASLLKSITPRPPTPGYTREPFVLWPREIGELCLRKIWYGLWYPQPAVNATDAMKFSYGHLLEETLLTYAEMAGHTVKDRQLKLTEDMTSYGGTPWKVRGKIDAVIDGVLVDVKSCSKTIFANLTPYYGQVDWYAKVGGYERAGILAVEKTSGRIRYGDVPQLWSRSGQSVSETTLLELESPTPPERRYKETAFNAFGRTLPDECLFCPFKYECWDGLRAFKYSYGPAFYTELRTAPRVAEMTREEVENEPLRG